MYNPNKQYDWLTNKKNESGVIITKKMSSKNKSSFYQWQKKARNGIISLKQHQKKFKY